MLLLAAARDRLLHPGEVPAPRQRWLAARVVILCLAAALAAGAGSPRAYPGERLEQGMDDGDAAPKSPVAETADLSSVSVIEVDRHDLPAWPVAPGSLAPMLAAAQGTVQEVEPNDTAADATPLGGINAVGRGSIYRLGSIPSAANGDLDYWSFSGMQGDRVYAATMTAWATPTSDTTLELFGTDGLTIIEADLDDGSIAATASSIAGARLPAAGTYYLRVRHATNASRIAPYFLHVRLQSGSPVAEVEPNDTPATANPLPAGGWVSGARNPAQAAEQDWFSFGANAGDTVFLSLDLDPERNGVQWNGRLGLGLFGDAGNQVFAVDDASAGSASNPLSEALFVTVKNAGTYYVFVDSASAAVGGSTATYNLSVGIHPATPIGVNCTEYASTDVPRMIGPGAATTDSTITIPGNPRIEDLNVSISLDHAVMSEIDAALISPDGSENSIFTDIGSTAPGGEAQMDLNLDDEAGSPPLSTVVKGVAYQPEAAYRLHWFKGGLAGGTWTLRLRDDTDNTNGGSLNGWSLTVCEPPPPPECLGTPVPLLGTDFELDNGGFTTAGPSPAPWQWGTPTTAPIATCQSGVGCWKTNLTGAYNAGANQDLLSPVLDLTGLGAPITVTWAQKYQMESASFDTFWLEAREVGGMGAVNQFQFLDSNMFDIVGSPANNLDETAGWGLVTGTLDVHAGKPAVQLRWSFFSDGTGQYAGVALDDVAVTACCTAASCDDGNPCTDDICDSRTGCTHINNDTHECSDGNPCTLVDACSGGACVPGSNPCEDNDACTIELCDGLGGCQHTPVSCNDGNPCTDDACFAATGCAHADNTLPCSDGVACTVGDLCAGGACVPGPPPPLRQFCGGGPITIPDSGKATPYPASVNVAAGSVVCSITAGLNGLAHTYPDDIDVLLSSPAAKNAIIVSDVGGGAPGAAGVSLTLDDAAAGPLPDTGPLVSGDFRPTNVGTGDTFAAPAPAPLGGSALSVFNGSNPNGTWNLWVMDDVTGDHGSVDSWCVNLRTLCLADAECDDGNPCTDDLCDLLTGGCTFINNTGSCDDGDPCTAGDVCGNGACQPGSPPAAPSEATDLDFAADRVTLAWSTVPLATRYDVVRGLTAGLPAGPGGADESCFDNLADITLVDSASPAAGSAFWYLVRGQTACASGPYGTQSDGTPQTTATCP